MRVAYLCLQTTYEGQASYAHVREIIAGLQRREVTVDLYEPAHQTRKRPSLLRRIWKMAQAQMKACARIKKADIVYIRHHGLAVPTAVYARWRGVRVVSEVNGPCEDAVIAYPWLRCLAGMNRFLFRQMLKHSDAVITVTPGLREWILGEAKNLPVFVIPNGANTDLFNPQAKTELQLPAAYVLFFGALAAWQGIGTSLAAVKQPQWPDGVHLVVVGDGQERERVEEAVRQDSRIHYLGRQPYKSLPGIIAGSVAGLSPMSSTKGRAQTGLFPLKLFETMACGVPVIVTDHPGQADLIRETSAGIIIPPDDPAALAGAVRTLCEAPEEAAAMGARGHASIVAAHSWDARAAATLQVLEEVCGAGGSAA